MRTGTVPRTRWRAADDCEALAAGALVGAWRCRLDWWKLAWLWPSEGMSKRHYPLPGSS